MDPNSDNSKSINKMADKIVNTDNFEWNDSLVQEFCNWFCRIPAHEVYKADRIKEFKASKQRKAILVTEDGKPQFEGDRPWYVTEKYHLGGAADLVNNKAYHPASNYKYFSTQEIAENYIIENKPCLSVNDVMKLAMSHNDIHNYHANLIQLAKNKL